MSIISSFPKDILLEVVQYLDVSEGMRFQSVSKKVKDVVDLDKKYFYDRIRLQFPGVDVSNLIDGAEAAYRAIEVQEEAPQAGAALPKKRGCPGENLYRRIKTVYDYIQRRGREPSPLAMYLNENLALDESEIQKITFGSNLAQVRDLLVKILTSRILDEQFGWMNELQREVKNELQREIENEIEIRDGDVFIDQSTVEKLNKKIFEFLEGRVAEEREGVEMLFEEHKRLADQDKLDIGELIYFNLCERYPKYREWFKCKLVSNIAPDELFELILNVVRLGKTKNLFMYQDLFFLEKIVLFDQRFKEAQDYVDRIESDPQFQRDLNADNSNEGGVLVEPENQQRQAF